MTCGERACHDGVLGGRRQLQQAHGVGDRRTALAHALGNLSLGQPKLLDQRPVRGGLFQGVEVGPLHVLDECPFHELLRRRLAHDDGHFRQTRQLCGAPAPFAGDDEERTGAVRIGGHHQRLDDPVRLNRGGQLVQGGLVEMGARLVGIGLQRGGGDQAHPAGLGLGAHFGLGRRGGRVHDQRPEATPEAAPGLCFWVSPVIRLPPPHSWLQSWPPGGRHPTGHRFPPCGR